MMQTKYLKSINLQIFLISLTLFFIKWFFSFYFYGFEDINIKIIFNPSGDYSYYPFVSQLSNFKFNEGYSKIFTDLNYIGFPFLVIDTSYAIELFFLKKSTSNSTSLVNNE